MKKVTIIQYLLYKGVETFDESVFETSEKRYWIASLKTFAAIAELTEYKAKR